MKAIIFGFIVLIVIGISGFIGFQYVSHQKQTPSTSNTQTTTLTGLLLPGKGDDYSFILYTNGKTVGIASQTIQLDKYANKNVQITGSYSGTTLYAYTIVEKK